MVSFAVQKLFSFMWSFLLIVDLSSCAIGVLLSKLSLVSKHLRFFSTFSSFKISICSFMLRSLIHFYLSFVQVIDIHQFVFYMLISIKIAPTVEDIFFSHFIFLASIL